MLPPPTDSAQRSAWSQSILESVLHQRAESHRRSEIVDRILLHPVLDVLTFFAAMFILFQVILTWAVPLQTAVMRSSIGSVCSSRTMCHGTPCRTSSVRA